MKIAYKDINFRNSSLALIHKINEIITEYKMKGYELTLRQVYYQLVARDIIPNNERSYKNIGNLISDGRLAGLIDWDAIVDRTRAMRANSHWDDPADIIGACARQFQYDKWTNQDNYVEVWVEKDALIGVVGRICTKLDVPYFSCRGYVSQSEMWTASQRFLNRCGQDIVVLHLGDHDPSGQDISRDIEERLIMFGVNLEFKRIALNMDQIEKYNPPPNPTKLTDTRCQGYIERFGYDCWELDALKPEVIDELISNNVSEYLDIDSFDYWKKEERKARELLTHVSDDWHKIIKSYNV